MISQKKIVMIASILVLIGLIGSLLTFRISYPEERVIEEKMFESTFNEIKISTDNARIEIIPTDEENASVVLTGNIRKKSRYNFKTEVKDQTLFVKADVFGKKIFQFFPKYLIVELYVPTKNYDLLQVDNKNGRIIVDDFNAKNIHLETDNGSVQINNVTANLIIAKTENGNVKGENVESDTIEAITDNGTITGNMLLAKSIDVSTNNGKIKLFEVTGDVIGKTSNGSILVEVEDLDRSVNLSTSNGRIEVKTENKPTNATINSITENGEIKVFGESKPHMVIGDGKHEIHLSTENGSINVFQ